MTSALIRLDYTKLETPNAVELYIRQLRNEIKKLYKENLCYKNVEEILSKWNIQPLPFDTHTITQLPEHLNYYSITATLDPNRFLNLELTTIEQQIRYFKQTITHHILDDVYHRIYATFERHKNGIIHCHAIIQIYDISPTNYTKILHAFTSKLTNKINSKINTIIKLTTDIPGWLKYMNKETEEEPISFNMTPHSIEHLNLPKHYLLKKPLEIISGI